MEEEDTKFRSKISSRKFILATIFTVAGSVGLFMDKIASGDYYLLAGAVLGAFAFGQFISNK